MVYLVLKKNLKQFLGLREKKKEVFADCWLQAHFQSQTLDAQAPYTKWWGTLSLHVHKRRGPTEV